MPANPNSSPEGFDQLATLFGTNPPDRYALSGWGSPDSDLRLPSGQLCRVRKVSIQEMIKQGVIDDFDTLTSLVTTEHVDKKSSSNKSAPPVVASLDGIMSDKGKVQKVLEMVDRIVMACVVAPKLQHPPVDEKDRAPGVAYTDWVPDADKNHIMAFVFGEVRDLEPFREGIAKPGDGMDNGADLETEAK